VNDQDALLRWIPLAPLLSAVVLGVMTGLLRRSATPSAVIAMGMSWVLDALFVAVTITSSS